MGGYVQEGSLDRLLLRPVSTMFSVMAADVTLHGIGSAIFGLVICVVSLVNLQLELTLVTLLNLGLAIKKISINGGGEGRNKE